MAALTEFPHVARIPLRWKDNDVYGHVNNVEYYSFFDTVINQFLITEAGLDIHAGEVLGVCAESHCTFTDSIAFPGTILAGLAVEHLGSASVRYAIGLFDAAEMSGAADPRLPNAAETSNAADPRLLAEGWFVHVFVDRVGRRPTPIPEPIRSRLAAISR